MHVVTMLLLLKSNAVLHSYSRIGLVAGAHCSEDFDGCEVGPCTAGTNCTDLTPEQEAAQGTAFHCTPCPQGYEKSDGVCVGTCHCMLFSSMVLNSFDVSVERTFIYSVVIMQFLVFT